MKLKRIPAGEFFMGSPNVDDPDALPEERPQHRVRISKPFYLGVHEVTRGQFRQFVQATGYRTEAEQGAKGGWGRDARTKKLGLTPGISWRNPGFEQSDDHPVVLVSWDDATAFIAWLSREEGRAYRLPTEAEWEYACRAGRATRFSSGHDSNTLEIAANLFDRTAKEGYLPAEFGGAMATRDGFVYTAPVGRFRANDFGLHDMHGNAFEWCSDRYAAD